MQRRQSVLPYAPVPHDRFEPYRWLLGDVSGSSLATDAAPRRTRRAAGMLALLSVVVFAAAVAGIYHAPAGCRSSPLALRLGHSAEATMTLQRGMQCSIQVPPGAAGIEALTVDRYPGHGSLSPRGMTGVIYRADAGFTGTDSFSFSLWGRGERQEGSMAILVRVVVE